MALPLPVLDDRRWADLVEEARALIPLYAPEWTDHNLHDPGITLVELLAWTAEMDLYQLNRIPASHRRKFLELLGIEPHPPIPARTVISFGLVRGPDALDLPVALEVEGTSERGEVVRFRTMEPVQVVPGEIRAIQCEDARGFRDLTAAAGRGETIATFGPDPHPGGAVYLGLSAPLRRDLPISLAVSVTGGHVADELKSRLRAEARARRDACPPDRPSCDGGGGPGPAQAGARERWTPTHHSAHTAWEILTAEGWKTLERVSAPPAPGQARDETRSLTLDGRITLVLNDEMVRRRVGVVEEELYYLRCRLVEGTWDAAPSVRAFALNGVPAEQAFAVSATVSWPIAAGAAIEGEPPAPGARARVDASFDEGSVVALSFTPQGAVALSVRELRLPSATKPGRLTVEAEDLGEGTGRPNQRAILSSPPVVTPSLAVFSVEEGRLRHWERRADFEASTGSDVHVVADPEDGILTFGDGERGRVPPEGAPLFADYDTTRADAGNLDRSHPVSVLSDSPHNRALLADYDAVKARLEVRNPVPAEGGRAAETVAEAAGRALEMREQPTMAVTAPDHEALAEQTPGASLARVFARPNLHPAFPCFEAPGVTTVIVVPHLPVDRPAPSPGLLRLVAAYLHPRRVLGTRVEVVGPTYVTITVRARVRAHAHADAAAVAARVIAAVREFFDPLTGGPDGSGWPFGRDVYRTEVLQVLDGTEGVDHVLSLDITAEGRPPGCANVCLSPTDLVLSGPHQIEVVSDDVC
jgi:predicted phage baseplate assembly protein